MTAASDAPANIDTGPAPTAAEIDTLAEAAVARWYVDAGFADAALQRIMDDVQFVVTDLPDQKLAFATYDVIYIDVDAAGHGWFIDATPYDDAEFADASGEAAGRMDLLTVLGHEIGNVLGLQDQAPDYAGLMSATLDTGTRLEFQGEAGEPAGSVVDPQHRSAEFTLAWMSFVAQNPALSGVLPQFAAQAGFSALGSGLFGARTLMLAGKLQ
jgi:hypothetical protein